MFRVEMEDGTFEDVAEINLGGDEVTNTFIVHAWFNIWTTASLPDWQILFESETGKTVLMGEVRKQVWLQTSNPTKKKLQRPLAPLGVMVDLRAEPFTKKEIQK
tara:strand:- start:217 stop:528 length:312 start_codon:yes stop_codon:yes gene_type:complete